ncbi:MAG: threonine/serine exporter [Ruminococcaceae bacterium]|nr:threonine/serine exporter [Oscillospiraceae bacterium]
MREEIIRGALTMVWAMIGTLGIALIFNVEKRVIGWVLLASFLCCVAYDTAMALGGGLFIASLIGSSVTTLYSYVMARVIKTPVTVMIIPGIIILVPGGMLYYTMLGAVSSDMAMFSKYGKEALLVASGLALGIIAVTAISRPINALLNRVLRDNKSRT